MCCSSPVVVWNRRPFWSCAETRRTKFHEVNWGSNPLQGCHGPRSVPCFRLPSSAGHRPILWARARGLRFDFGLILSPHWSRSPQIPSRSTASRLNQLYDKKKRHNRAAPYWAAALIVFGSIGISTTFLTIGGFWNGYVLDITGPAWNYILFRGLSHAYSDNAWTRFFTPIRTFAIFVLVAYGIEFAQYLKLHDSTFDPWDFLAYVSLLIPLFLIDFMRQR